MISNLESSLNAAMIAAKAIEDKKGIDCKILDIHDLTVVADYFVVASGQNPNQLRAMADAVEGSLHEAGYNIGHSEGMQTATWVLLDFGGVIVHIFNNDDRRFYNLEKVWADAKEIPFDGEAK